MGWRRKISENSWGLDLGEIVELDCWFWIGRVIGFLVGGFNPSEKYQSVGMIIPNIWKNKNCSKPPISFSCESNMNFCAYNSPVWPPVCPPLSPPSINRGNRNPWTSWTCPKLSSMLFFQQTKAPIWWIFLASRRRGRAQGDEIQGRRRRLHAQSSCD